MFAEDTNLFFSHSGTNILLEEMNKELMNESNQFDANKLSLNVKKIKFSFFDKSPKKEKLKKVQSKQKDALRIIFNQPKTSPSETLLLSLNVLNVYQINICAIHS